MSAEKIAEKVCTKCGTTKPLDEFYRVRGGAGGRRGQCKRCEAPDGRARAAVHTRAHRALADRHRDEFDALLAAERERVAP